jgi:hypothetical protein
VHFEKLQYWIRQFECFFVAKWRKNVSRIDLSSKLQTSRYDFSQKSTRSDESTLKCTTSKDSFYLLYESLYPENK